MRRAQDDPSPERSLPNNLEAERALIGAVIVSNEGWQQIAAAIVEADFYRAAHRLIFRCMAGLIERRVAIDFVTLKDALAVSGDLDECGGPAYIASLTDGVPRTTNVEYYCLGVGERILTADLHWIPSGDITTDERLLAFDEHPRLRGSETSLPRRRWQLGAVLRSEPAFAECVRVILDDGTDVVCTTDHQWLVTGSKHGREWAPAETLLVGRVPHGPKPSDPRSVVLKPVEPWAPLTTWRAGWLAGLLDGEGTITMRAGGGGSRMGLSQRPGAVLSAAMVALDEYGFRYGLQTNRTSGVQTIDILGGLTEHLRLLGTIRPTRLLRDFQTKWHPRLVKAARRRVVAVERVGRQEIQQITTSTGTYIGEGCMMHNCGIVRGKARLRRAIFAANQILTDAYTEEPLEALVERGVRELLSASEPAHSGAVAIDAAVRDYVSALDTDHGFGIPTGFRDLDDLVGGLQKGTLTIIAARPSMGKSTICVNICDTIAQAAVPTALFSLEMSQRAIAVQVLSQTAHVDATRIARKLLGERDWGKLGAALVAIEGRPFYLVGGAHTATQVDAWTRRLKVEHGAQVVCIDYLQLMMVDGRARDRQQEVAYLSRALKRLAEDQDVAVVALSQLSRAPEGRKDKRPQLSDLRDSGALEQDADLVCLLFRQDMYDSDPNNPNAGTAEVIVAKNRSGPTGTIRLAYLKEQCRFCNVALV